MREQLDLAQEFARRYMGEFHFDSQPTDDSYHHSNGYFESCDAEVAYCMVRHLKPRRIFEVGSGYSTRLLAAALKANRERDRVDGELLTVDPCPVRLPRNGLGDSANVVAEPVQNLDAEIFKSLLPGDILFLDSSHVVGVGSDLVREFLQILPTLNPGVLVHLHDIFFLSIIRATPC